MSHRYDHNCHCETCSEYEQTLAARIQVDRDAERERDRRRREDRERERKRNDPH